MIAKLVISPVIETRAVEIKKILNDFSLTPNHPDLLYFPYSSKLGIAETRKIKEHFSLKPYSAIGRVVALEEASELTEEAQNALLKTLEELPEEAILIMGASSEVKFLPTVLSRCEIVRIQNSESRIQNLKYNEDIEKLVRSSIEERFEYVEKLKDREEFLLSMIQYFHKNLRSHLTSGNVNFTKELLQAEEWAEANVNMRAILEYLMLVMPKRL